MDDDWVDLEPSNEYSDLLVSYLEEVVFGQREACNAVAGALVRHFVGINDPDRPIGVFMFAGPSGCGKTEMGKAIANLFDQVNPESKRLIINSGEFVDRWDISKFTGSSPGYLGYGDDTLITPSFLEQKNTVIIFDEFEKAHPALAKFLLTLFSEGKITVYAGKQGSHADKVELDFTRSIIILTTNQGAGEIQDARTGHRLGFLKETADKTDLQKIGLQAIKQHWRDMPEFTNRMDAIVIFNELSRDTCRLIIDKFITKANLHSLYHNELNITDDLKEWILDNFNKSMGGRGIDQFINDHILTPAANLKGLRKGMPFEAYLKDGKVMFHIQKKLFHEAIEQIIQLRPEKSP